MADRAHSWTDWKIEELEKELDKIYARAEKELEDRAQKYFDRFSKLDEQKRALLEAGKLTEEEYNRWKTGKIMTGKHWTEMKEQTAQDLLKVNQTAASYINDQLPAVYTRNYNQVVAGINGQIRGYSFELVDSATVRRLATDDKTLLPYKYIDGVKDVRWNTGKVNSEILQGILQGDSIPNLAKRLSNVTEMNRTSAIRNARTACTSAENKGRMDMMEDAEEKGVHVQKKWIATHDDRTRESHLLLDGSTIDQDEEFDNGLMYPGDPNGEPEEVYNCRCTLGYKVVSFAQLKVTAPERDQAVVVEDSEGRLALALERGGEEASGEIQEVLGVENLSEKTKAAIDDYIEGNGNKFTPAEVREIKENMTTTTEPLYRIEDMSWMGEDLETGSSFTFDKPLKGFSNDFDAVKTVVAEGDDAGLYEDNLIAMFQTVDETYHLDVSGISRNHADEAESLVGGTFEVIDEFDGPRIGGHDTWVFLIKQIKK